MLLAIPVLRQNAQIMLDFQNNTTLVPENALFYFKQKRTNSGIMCAYHTLNCSFVKLLIQISFYELQVTRRWRGTGRRHLV